MLIKVIKSKCKIFLSKRIRYENFYTKNNNKKKNKHREYNWKVNSRYFT